ncbi:uncharacterized protein SPSK_08780 [Sporothrix schenckii 1099-18]|uniref:Uncharacterized protein n=1 Tax=Sporothrix schenckii 1099-18 TaxID=1397361 RepID=A0A0F2M597_SPOSC|nr:uncharacterized protein SPSK_08780 [Sporothrix schenckii 1099-18]KJR84274.1 hypothetical protein SPSK_08780 [Sporothrix schenckii 1099-18]
MDSPSTIPTYDGEDAERVFARSRAHWQQALAQALALPSTAAAAAPKALDVQRALFRTPALPDSLPRDADTIYGMPFWTGAPLKPCAHRNLQGPKEKFSLRTKYRIRVTVAPAESMSFATWPGTPHNGVAWLALGWAYVLSASLAERQGVSVEYRDEDTCNVDGQTDGVQHDNTQQTVSLPYATPAERRWWRAITAPGAGWVLADGGLTPWAVDVAEEGLGRVAVATDADEIDAVAETPPTARQAARYLARMCAFFRLGSQSSAAFAAALTFPLHSHTFWREENPICLPRPRLGTDIGRGGSRGRGRGPGRGRGRGRGRVHDVDAIDPACDLANCPLSSEFANLSYYLSLSLAPWVIGSALFSAFWERDVPCHLAGAWIQPAAAIVIPILWTETGATRPDGDFELFAKVLSGTRSAPLWLGVALCGHGRFLQSVYWYLSHLQSAGYLVSRGMAAAWTGLQACFLHDLLSASPQGAGLVSRAHVCRLRHAFTRNYPPDENFQYMPLHPWPPFGVMRVEDVELEIRAHVTCGHRWTYSHWTWLVPGADTDQDDGFFLNRSTPMPPARIIPPPPAPDSPLDATLTAALEANPIQPTEWDKIRTMSRHATETIFWWANTQVERGFAGTVLPQMPAQGDRLPATGSPKQLKHYDAMSVEVWRDGVVQADAPGALSRLKMS